MTVSPALTAVEKRQGGYIPKDMPDHGAGRFDLAGGACVRRASPLRLRKDSPMFEFWFRVAWGSCAVVWLVGLAVFSWEMLHVDTPDDGCGN